MTQSDALTLKASSQRGKERCHLLVSRIFINASKTTELERQEYTRIQLSQLNQSIEEEKSRYDNDKLSKDIEITV